MRPLVSLVAVLLAGCAVFGPPKRWAEPHVEVTLYPFGRVCATDQIGGRWVRPTSLYVHLIEMQPTRATVNVNRGRRVTEFAPAQSFALHWFSGLGGHHIEVTVGEQTFVRVLNVESCGR